jgi:glycosyltransferase involved in cell wall biosynthesis
MKILMSAFSCGPGQGSEPGVGWNIALETARMGHEVTVFTQTEFKEDIERELATGTLPANLRFDIFTPGWLETLRDIGLRCGLPSLTWQTISLLWQFCALFHARRYPLAAFDLVHHVTFAGIRHPTLLTRLGIPTVIGPLGGGDRVPMALRKSFPWKEWWTELVRDAYNVSLRIDPITRSAFRHARLIVLRTDASLVAVPPRYRNKVHIKGGLGIAEAISPSVRRRSPEQPLRLLYAGNLFHLKGVHLGIRALASARARGANATLTIVGAGPARAGLAELTRNLGLSDYVIWCNAVSRHQLLQMYADYHAFLFPSLRDAFGTVILEAWAHGLPVICLALGGPGKLVDDRCGRVVPAANRSEDDCVAGLCTAIEALATDEDLRMALSYGAIKRYRESSWSTVVGDLYNTIEDRLQHRSVQASTSRPRYSFGSHAS